MKFQSLKIELSNDIPSIGLLRGIASAMVCLYHLSNGNKFFLPDTNLLKQLGELGRTGVQVFFIISGFVIPYAMFQKNYSIHYFFVFLKKRIIRIEPPYLLSIVLVLLLNFISTLSPYYRGLPFHIDWANVASHIAYLNVFTGEKWLTDVYWTLAVEFQYYILIAVAFKLIVSTNMLHRLLFFLVFMALFWVAFLGFDFIFYHAVYFMLGILLFQYCCKIIDVREYCLLSLVALLLLFCQRDVIFTIVAVLTLLVIFFVKRIPAFLSRLGLISYSLYLIHIPLGGRIINISETLIPGTFLRACMVFVAFFICIAGSFVFYNLAEKRFKKWSAAIQYQHQKHSLLVNENQV